MTNREWMNGLSDEDFAREAMSACDNEHCYLDDDSRPDITNCNECFVAWLKQEHKEDDKYITNHARERVRVPKAGEEVYIIELHNNESQWIRKIEWQEHCNLLYLLYHDGIFYSLDEAMDRLAKNQEIVIKACNEAGWSKQVNYICGTPIKDNPFDCWRAEK